METANPSAPLAIILDPDEPLASHLSSVLARYGFETLYAPDVQAALAARRKRPPALILCASQLPDMPGIQALRLLHQQPGPAPLTIMLAEKATPFERSRAHAVGASLILDKPLDEHQLAHALAARTCPP